MDNIEHSTGIDKHRDKTSDNKYFKEQDCQSEELNFDGEDDDVFSSLAIFSANVLAAVATPSEALQDEQRQSKPLSPDGHDLSYSIKLIQDLITFDVDEPDVAYRPESLDEVGKLVAVSHLLAAVVTSLDPRHLRRLATRLVSDTSHWVARIFRYSDSTAFLHEDAREGVIRIIRMMFYHKYADYAKDGVEALSKVTPVIYAGTSVRHGLLEQIASQFALNKSSIRIVPCNTVVGSPLAMDTSALDRMMEEDLNSQRRPLFVIANTGGGLVGGVDNMSRIQELCTKYDAWLHVEGHSLAALALQNSANTAFKIGDSMTLQLSSWLGIPALPYVTLYKSCGNASVYASGLTSLNLHVRLSSLPLWMSLQYMGLSGIVSRLGHSFELSQRFQKHLLALENVRILSPYPKFKEGFLSINELMTRPISASQLMESACSTIVFQYVSSKDSDQKNSEYYDSLNSWLGQVVRRDVGVVPLELVPLDEFGLAMRWSSLEGPRTQSISGQHVDRLIESLKDQIDILNATVRQKVKYTELIASEKNLTQVELPMWAGLGGVRYVPDCYVASETPWTNSVRLEVSRLNEHLVSQLRHVDSAFSLGECPDGTPCVRFGMITADTDIQELLLLVIEAGREIETSTKFITQMTEVVKKGIETATADLQRENEERLWQEGILRHVPIVSSVYNWLSPPPPPGVKGRTLDLTAGVLESTENIYRYHMQVKHSAENSRNDAKLPPAPSVVTSFSPTPSAGSHSRASSASSPQTSAPQPVAETEQQPRTTPVPVPLQEQSDVVQAS